MLLATVYDRFYEGLVLRPSLEVQPTGKRRQEADWLGQPQSRIEAVIPAHTQSIEVPADVLEDNRAVMIGKKVFGVIGRKRDLFFEVTSL